MCGIAGEVTYEGAALHRDFTRDACSLMIHRGPDEQAFYEDARVMLGICRLKVIGLSGGMQPVYSQDRKIMCVANGEIYNHKELRRRLERLGRRVRGASDMHVIPDLYEEYGDEFVHELSGMYAIAIYDTRSGELKLVTDRVGKKPLFYGRTGDGRLVFASELGPLITYPGIRRQVDPLAVDQYLSYRVIPAPYTILKAVRKVPPGSIITFRPQQPIRAERYWRFDFSAAPHNAGGEAAAGEIAQRLTTAVADRLEADVPLGAMLSGGLDSSLVAAIASRLLPGQLNTFSVGFEHPSFDETQHARAVAGHCGTRHHSYRIRATDAHSAVDAILRHMGEPYAFPSAIASYYMYRLASEHVTVVLTGDGADEIFAGYNRYKIFRRLPEVLPGDKAKVDPAALGEGGQDLADCYQAVLIDGVRNGVKERLFSQGFRNCLPDPFPFNYLRDRFRDSEGQTAWLNRLLQLDAGFWLPDAQLVKIDRMAMAHSVEPRSPMLDHRLIEYVTSLSPELKLSGDDEKAILKSVAGRYLPESIVRRRKQELAVPLEDWLSSQLRPLIQSTLLSEGSLDRGYFDPDALREFVMAFRREDSYAIWTLFMLERWHQIFIDGEAGIACRRQGEPLTA